MHDICCWFSRTENNEHAAATGASLNTSPSHSTVGTPILQCACSQHGRYWVYIDGNNCQLLAGACLRWEACPSANVVRPTRFFHRCSSYYRGRTPKTGTKTNEDAPVTLTGASAHVCLVARGCIGCCNRSISSATADPGDIDGKALRRMVENSVEGNRIQRPYLHQGRPMGQHETGQLSRRGLQQVSDPLSPRQQLWHSTIQMSSTPWGQSEEKHVDFDAGPFCCPSWSIVCFHVQIGNASHVHEMEATTVRRRRSAGGVWAIVAARVGTGR